MGLEMEDMQEMVGEIIGFLQENEYILNSHITEAYSKDYFTVIPEDWFSALMSFTYPEYLQILSHIPSVKSI